MRVGIIGVGAIAQVHISAISEAGQDIVALCDIEIEKCCRANEKFNLNAQVYSNYMDMLEYQKLDAVHICTPHYLHAEMICAALKKEINVLCEKPIAISFEQLKINITKQFLKREDM